MRWPETSEGAATADGEHRRRWWTLAVLALAAFMIGIDATVLNAALPY